MGKNKGGREPLHAEFLRNLRIFCDNGITTAKRARETWRDAETVFALHGQTDEQLRAGVNRGKAQGTLDTYTTLLEMLDEELHTPAPVEAQTTPLFDGDKQTEIESEPE